MVEVSFPGLSEFLQFSHGLFQSLEEASVLPHQVDLLTGIADDDFQLVQSKGLGDVVIGPSPDGLNGRVEGCITGHDDDDTLRMGMLNLSQDLNSVSSGHHQVCHHQIEKGALQSLDGLQTILVGMDHPARLV